MTADNLDALSAAAVHGDAVVEGSHLGYVQIQQSGVFVGGFGMGNLGLDGKDYSAATAAYIASLWNAHRSGALAPASAVEAAVLDERERCAVTAEHRDRPKHGELLGHRSIAQVHADNIAAAIRKGEQP